MWVILLREQPVEILTKLCTHHIIHSSSHQLPVLELLHDETLGQHMHDEATSDEDVFDYGHMTGIEHSGDEFLTHGVEQRPSHVFLLKVS